MAIDLLSVGWIYRAIVGSWVKWWSVRQNQHSESVENVRLKKNFGPFVPKVRKRHRLDDCMIRVESFWLWLHLLWCIVWWEYGQSTERVWNRRLFHQLYRWNKEVCLVFFSRVFLAGLLRSFVDFSRKLKCLRLSLYTCLVASSDRAAGTVRDVGSQFLCSSPR